MAGFAFDIKLDCLHTLIFMRIMTGKAGHFAIHKTFAGSKHAVLITVYVYLGNRLSGVFPKKVEQFVTCGEGKRRFGFRESAAMAESAQIEALLAGTFCRVKYCIAGLCGRVFLVVGDVFHA